jgi:hypothetical protein
MHSKCQKSATHMQIKCKSYALNMNEFAMKM